MKKVLICLVAIMLIGYSLTEARGFHSSRSSVSTSRSYSSPTTTSSRSYSSPTSSTTSRSYSSPTTSTTSTTSSRSYSTPSQSTRTMGSSLYGGGGGSFFGGSNGGGFINGMLRGSMLGNHYYAPMGYYGGVPYGSYGMMPYFGGGGGYIGASFGGRGILFYMLLKLGLLTLFGILCFISFEREKIGLGVLYIALFIFSLII